jgi:hypothetical protein
MLRLQRLKHSVAETEHLYTSCISEVPMGARVHLPGLNMAKTRKTRLTMGIYNDRYAAAVV